MTGDGMDRLYNVEDPEWVREAVSESTSSNNSSPSHPYDSFIGEGQKAVGQAVDVFERMTGVEEDPLEPKMMTDGGRSQDTQTMKDVSHTREGYDGTQESMERGVTEKGYDVAADGGVTAIPIGGMRSEVSTPPETADSYMGDIM